jgi:hypothetical protein
MPKTSQFLRAARSSFASAKIALAFDSRKVSLHARAISARPGQPVPVLVSPGYARRL